MPSNFRAAFALGTVFNLALVVAEFGFGYLSNSLALISDGVDNFTDASEPSQPMQRTTALPVRVKPLRSAALGARKRPPKCP